MSQPTSSPDQRPERSGVRRALVVDDERALADLVGTYLTRDGFEVSMAHDGQQAVERARQVDPDVMVLDLGLPLLDGVEVCRQVRTFSDCYIVMLTARTEEIDKLIGLSVGADDYLTKPFSPRELVARIHAMLRRPRASAASGQSPPEGPPRVFGALSIDVNGREIHLDGELVARIHAMLRRPRASAASGQCPPEGPPRVFGALSIDVNGREIHLDGELVTLTRTEFDVLAALSARPTLAFSRRLLIDAVWDQSWVGDEHLVDVHVGHLRRKLGDDPGSPRYVRTVRGIGYRMGDGR